MKEAELILLIKKKRELNEISEKVIVDSLSRYIKKYKLDISDLKPRDAEIIVKAVRADLRNYVGQYQISVAKKEKLLKEMDFQSLLETHSSTKERIKIYPKLKELLAKIHPKSLLDLGCGINPIALASKEIEYSACDINESDLKVVQSFFEKNNVSGKVFVYDLSKYDHDLPNADVVLLFKVLDHIKKSNSRIIRSLIQGLKCRYLLVSFSTKKLSGKSMNNPKRFWFEKIISSLGYKYEFFNFENEIFYLIDKSTAD